MLKNSFYVNLILDETNCTMISPGYEYIHKEDGGMPNRKPWNPDNLNKLEQMISTTMKERHAQELATILTTKIPSLYIDCRNKWEDDIMFFILKEYIKQSKTPNKNTIVTNAIWRHIRATESKEKWNEYIQNNTPTIEEILQYYTQSLKNLLEKNPDERYSRNLLNFESDITFDGLNKLMEDKWEKYLYLYLDKIHTLSIEEQQRINMLLYTRWNISIDKRIRLKINNGHWSWKTRYTMSGHRVATPHDYSERGIYEDELPQTE